MSTVAPWLEELPRIVAEAGRLIIPVPWRHAERLRDHLERCGIGSTLFLAPYMEEARIEIWPGTDTASVLAALDVSRN